jgi:phosphatidyl-myo-inositol alpha-mannosyltransferase
MRIGIVSEYYYPTLGGIQEHVHHFALEAMSRGHDVRIITSNVKDLPEDIANGVQPVPTIRVGRSMPIYNNGSIARVTVGRHLGRTLQEVFDREAFDVIHVHAPLTPTLPLLALTRSNTITVGTLHTNFKGSAFLRLFRKNCQRYLDHLDGLIAVSKTAASALAPYFETDCRIIPNGIDVQQFRPEIPRLPAFEDGRFNLLWVGRMEPRNGLDRMIQAFVQACRQRPEMRLIVIGDGPLRGTYESMVPEALRPLVHFLGFVNANRPALYASADVLCVPATISSFGITLLEGMAAAKPIIASDIDGFRDVMTHEKEGLLIDTGDIAAFSAAILKLASDRELATALGRTGRATALLYSWPRVTDAVLGFYDEVLERKEQRRVSCPSA